MRRLFPLFLFVATACSTATRATVVEYRALPNSNWPFTEAVRVDGLLYLSGMIGNDSTGRLAPGGIGPETRQTLENIKTVLSRNGLGMDRLVKCTVFMADISEWAAMNQVYVLYFPTTKPARSAIGNSGLVFNARVEIECIAAMR